MADQGQEIPNMIVCYNIMFCFVYVLLLRSKKALLYEIQEEHASSSNMLYHQYVHL